MRSRGAMFCAHADRRWEVALFSVAGVVARWPDDRGFAAHFADERPGGRAAGERRGGDILEFNARSGRRRERGCAGFIAASTGCFTSRRSG